jgi:hypothetical protein
VHPIDRIHGVGLRAAPRVACSAGEVNFGVGENMANIQDELTGQKTKMPATEGRVATEIEKRTARLPSDVFLWSALSSMAGSLVLTLFGKQKLANFVGQWVPTLLIFGLYNKIVKVAGHDRYDSGLADA